jgi:Cu(I)/Ag(I) efflux system membrane fusion protein
VIFGCGKGKETTTQQGHKEEVKQEAKKADDMEMKGLTMESIQKEGKVQEVAPGTVQISPVKQQLIGVKFGTVEMRPLEKVIRTVGRIDYDEKRIVTVSPKIGGWIEDLYVDFTGRFVKQGEPLLTIYSPELVSTQEEYLIALRAKRDLSKSPFPEVAGSGDSLAESAKRRLKLWDINDDQIKALEESGQAKKTLTLYSPFSGFVLEKAAYKGMNVMPGVALFKLADLSVVWLIADVYEYELPFIRLGQQASVQLSYIPGEIFTGKAIYIYPSLNPETRTAKVRFELPNSHGKLKPEMYANVEIKVHLGQKLTVPEGAIIDTGLRQLAIIDKGNGYFEPREVKVGSKVDNYYEVIKGLKAGERVVTSANFLIDSESKLKEAVGGMAGMPGM